VARNKTSNRISESSFWYVELKHFLRESLDHGFKYLRWIVCWEFDKNINKDSEFAAVQETDLRKLEIGKDDDGYTIYFLNSRSSAVKIQVIRLRQFLQERLGIEFKDQS
jgi:hypothetical protein